MSSLNDRSVASLETRRAREQRADGEVSLPFGERVEVACPVCGGIFKATILGDPATDSPSWGRCAVAGCDAFLKYRHATAVESSNPDQTDLGEFAGGEKA